MTATHAEASNATGIIDVLVAIDSPLLRLGFVQALSAGCGMRRVQQVSCEVQDLPSALASQAPDIVVMAALASHADAADALDRVREACPSCRVVLITDRIDVARARAALRGGVRGILTPTSSVEQVQHCLQTVAGGQRHLDPAIATQLAEGLAEEALTERETDVLRLLSQGHCNKLIARDLGIAVGTVKSHVRGVLSKLDASCRTHAVAIASRKGLVEPRRDGPVS
jgi:DNA-binding NarL/FixJ family response regulator